MTPSGAAECRERPFQEKPLGWNPDAHLIEQVFRARVEARAPVELEQEQNLGLDGADEAPELADKRMGGAEAGPRRRCGCRMGRRRSKEDDGWK